MDKNYLYLKAINTNDTNLEKQDLQIVFKADERPSFSKLYQKKNQTRQPKKTPKNHSHTWDLFL